MPMVGLLACGLTMCCETFINSAASVSAADSWGTWMFISSPS